MTQFNYRIGNIEARTAQGPGSIGTLEIVQWGGDICWTIVSFLYEGDQWHARFSGARPLEVRVNWHHLRQLIQASYDFLNGDRQETQS